MTGFYARSSLAAFVEYGLLKTLSKWRARCLSAFYFSTTSPVQTNYGVLMRGNWRDRTFQYCRFGTYGHVLADYLAGQNSDFAFVDIGANQGLYSLLAARNPHCRGVVAFEPVAATFALLGENVDLNKLGEKIRIVEAAVSRHRGTARIVVNHAHSGIASLRHGATDAGEEIQIVDMADVDPILPESVPLIVKIDVEGHEEAVIEALMTSEHISRISACFYEIDRRWTDATTIEAMLKARGFTHFSQYGFGRHYDILASRC
jgi:FkbM family methyltransferase